MDRSSFEASRRARAKQRELEGHPAPGDLAAYHAGRLTEERERQIKGHLAVCQECALLYDSLIEFEQDRPEPSAAGEDPSAAAWLRMRERLREAAAAEASAAEEEPRSAVQPLQRRRVPVWQRPVVAWAVAAGLAVCVVGLAIRDSTPPQLPVEQSEPRIIEPGAAISLELEGDEGVHRGGGETAQQEPVDSSTPLLEFEIRLPGADPEATYEAEILNAGGEPVWKGQGKPSGGYLGIELGRSYLPAGAYRFRVHEIEGNERTLLGTTESFNLL